MIGKDLSTRVLELGLAAASLRQRVLAHNIANVGTPGFKRSRVEFERQLTEAVQERRSVVDVEPAVVRETTTSGRPDGNNVDIELEMTQLAQNQVLYSALTRQLSDHFARLRAVISDGRR